MNVKGRVKAVKQRITNYSIMVGDDWYSGFDKCPFKKGDLVNIDFKQDGRFRNMEKAELINVDEPKPAVDKVKRGYLKVFSFTDEKQLENAVNMFVKDHNVLAWQPCVIQVGAGLWAYVCFVTYEE